MTKRDPIIYEAKGWDTWGEKRYQVDWWNRGEKRDSSGRVYRYNARWLAIAVGRFFALFGRAVEVTDEFSDDEP